MAHSAMDAKREWRDAMYVIVVQSCRRTGWDAAAHSAAAARGRHVATMPCATRNETARLSRIMLSAA